MSIIVSLLGVQGILIGVRGFLILEEGGIMQGSPISLDILGMNSSARSILSTLVVRIFFMV